MIAELLCSGLIINSEKCCDTQVANDSYYYYRSIASTSVSISKNNGQYSTSFLLQRKTKNKDVTRSHYFAFIRVNYLFFKGGCGAYRVAKCASLSKKG